MRGSIIALLSLISFAFACSREAPKDAAEVPPKEAAVPETPPADAGGPAEPASNAALEEVVLPPELEKETPAVAAPPTVHVLDQGSEPRQMLSWKLEPGLEERFTLESGMDNVVLVTVVRMAAPSRTTQYEIRIASKAIEADGALRVVFGIDTLRSAYIHGNPKQNEHLEKAETALRGVSGSFSLTAQGVVKDFQVELPANAPRGAKDISDNLTWAFTRMFPVLPQVPVGQGAKWTVHRGIGQGGVHVNELSTFEVTKLEGARVELGVAVEQAAAPQEYRPPGTDADIKLAAFWGKGDGSIAVDLTKLVPYAATGTAEITKNASKRAAREPKTVLMLIQTNRRLALPAP